MLLFKLWIAILFIAILISLFTGLNFLVRPAQKENTSSKKNVVNALTVRVILSALLILSLVLGFYKGWITPHILSQSQSTSNSSLLTEPTNP